jgi:Bacterial archaeo-eukaryotic release factor family 3
MAATDSKPAFDTTSFDVLARHTDGTCVSIYLPVDRSHPHDRETRLELKGLIGSAREQLQATGTADIDHLLSPAEALLDRPVVAEHSGGVALFLAPGFVAEHVIETPVGPLATTGRRFTVGPLLASVAQAPRCYVLTVGADNVALFKVDGSHWSECDVPDLPESVEQALWYERVERMSSAHSGGPVGAAGLSTIGHGSGAQDEDRKRRLSRFFQKVDSAVIDFLRDEPEAPLIVAGTARSVAGYQHVTRHHRVVAAAVGSPEELTASELHHRVEALHDSMLPDAESVLFGRLSQSLGTGLASTDLDEVRQACAEGRVGDLLVACTSPRWTPDGRPDELLEAWEPDAVDIVNETIVEAWLHGTAVHRVAADRLPGAVPVAALYRY